jgi:hypothetical protein
MFKAADRAMRMRENIRQSGKVLFVNLDVG